MSEQALMDVIETLTATIEAHERDEGFYRRSAAASSDRLVVDMAGHRRRFGNCREQLEAKRRELLAALTHRQRGA